MTVRIQSAVQRAAGRDRPVTSSVFTAGCAWIPEAAFLRAAFSGGRIAAATTLESRLAARGQSCVRGGVP